MGFVMVGFVMVATEAVPVDPSSNEWALVIVTMLVALLAVAVPIAFLVGLLVLAGRVRRHGERLAHVEARLADVDDRQPARP